MDLEIIVLREIRTSKNCTNKHKTTFIPDSRVGQIECLDCYEQLCVEYFTQELRGCDLFVHIVQLII